MSCAAPGGNARGGLRRAVYRELRTSACDLGRRPRKCLNLSGMGVYFLPCRQSTNYWWSFTLQLSGFGVERGRLGEVVSLVGDCRPPPPGNPRRPAYMGKSSTPNRQLFGGSSLYAGGIRFTPKCSEDGDIRSSSSLHSSLYEYQNKHNLKELKNPQYFKKNHSSFSCTGKNPVLEFYRLHSHLCGSLEVKPPPIAITNVLETG